MEQRTILLAKKKAADRSARESNVVSTSAATAPPAAAVEALLRRPKSGARSVVAAGHPIAERDGLMEHTWREAGPLGIKVHAVSSDSLDAEQGVYVTKLNKVGLPAELQNAIISGIECGGGMEGGQVRSEHTGLESCSYNHVMGLLKAAATERPLKIFFQRRCPKEKSLEAVEEEAVGKGGSRSIVHHRWNEDGPLGLRLKSVSSESLDTPEGVFVSEITAESVPLDVLNSIISTVTSRTVDGDTVHEGLEDASYNQVLTLLKGAGRPLKVAFRSQAGRGTAG